MVDNILKQTRYLTTRFIQIKSYTLQQVDYNLPTSAESLLYFWREKSRPRRTRSQNWTTLICSATRRNFSTDSHSQPSKQLCSYLTFSKYLEVSDLFHYDLHLFQNFLSYQLFYLLSKPKKLFRVAQSSSVCVGLTCTYISSSQQSFRQSPTYGNTPCYLSSSAPWKTAAKNLLSILTVNDPINACGCY